MAKIFIFTLVYFLLNANCALARCTVLPSGTAHVRLNNITVVKNGQCGIEIEVIDPLKQTWLPKGIRRDFWSEDSDVCKALPGTTMTLQLIEECCDANYDWCDAKWKVNGVTKEANGNRIYSPKGNRTF
jgi:hypothetical protein